MIKMRDIKIITLGCEIPFSEQEYLAYNKYSEKETEFDEFLQKLYEDDYISSWLIWGGKIEVECNCETYNPNFTIAEIERAIDQILF